MNEELPPQGEFHHFQLVNQNGDIPLSISVLVHYNRKENQELQEPITANDIIEFHQALQSFDGNFVKAFADK